jgi:hypothetical protein
MLFSQFGVTHLTGRLFAIELWILKRRVTHTVFIQQNSCSGCQPAELAQWLGL